MKLAHRSAGAGSHYEPIGGTLATRRGSLLALADSAVIADHIDRIAIERLINGELDSATDEEKYVAARYLCDLADPDLSIPAIADRIGASTRSVQRWSDDGWPARTFTASGACPIAGERYPDIDSAWAAKTRPTDDGHLLWIGPIRGGVPAVNFHGISSQAARIAYHMAHGRHPEGSLSARPNCGIDLCVRPEHIAAVPRNWRRA
jgi:hypothetical protein